MKENKKIPEFGLVNMLLNYSDINEDLVLYFKKVLDENYGLVKVKFPHTIVLTDRAEVMAHFLKKNHKNYRKTALVRNAVQNQIGDGLFTSDGDYWLKQRRTIQPGFCKKRLEGAARIMVEEINYYMDTVLDRHVETNEEVDLVNIMGRIAFKVITKSLFGQEIEDSKLDTIGKTIANGQEYVTKQSRKPYLKPWYYVNGDRTENERSKKARADIILSLIKERKESGEDFDDLLGMLLDTEYEDGSKMTNKQLLDEIVVLLIAGHETSAITMSWAWFLICSHPEVEDKLLGSVMENLGDKDPTFTDLRGLGYTLQVLEETMRMYPALWIIDREPLEDDEIEGFKIKKGEDIGGFLYGLHRNPNYWEEPDSFDPNRFTAENKKKQTPYSYLPFGGGPRLCIGKNYAQMEMQFTLAMLIRRYKFILSPNQVTTFKASSTLHPRNGIKVRVEKRILK